MTDDRWTETERLFAAALAAPPGERAAVLNGAPPDLKADVLSLLDAHDADGPLTETAGATQLLGLDLPPLGAPEADMAGRRIGPYRVLREVGRGGMGTVYAAERADGAFRQSVALKRIRPDLPALVAGTVRARFLRERDVLAGLEHPAIARLLDGGETEDGEPYFAMEFVDGEPITESSDARRLTVRDRLALVLQVCEAVAYAHRRLVVHRDLKPSNVLVTPEGQVKLLDFGVAKLLDPDREQTVLTSDARPYTPDYAAPEQIEGDAVGTAADVWALGVLLHRLLADRRPFRPRRGATSAPTADPEPPSRSASRPAREDEASPETLADARSTTPDRLRHAIEGDLDAIVARCLRPEPEARYPSVNALADDLRRHLDGLPVEARRGGRRYVAGRFVRRHRVGVAGAGALAVLVVVFVALLAQERTRARAEAAKAGATADFLVDLFLETDPADGHGADYTVREALDVGADRVERLDGQPEVKAQMLDVLGRVYRALGAFGRADSLHQAAVAVARVAFGPDAPPTLDAEHHYAYLLDQMDRDAEAEALYRRVLAVRRRTGDPDGLVESTSDYGQFLYQRGRLAEADPLVAEGLAVLRAHPDAGPPDHGGDAARASFLYLLGKIRAAEGQTANGERLIREALATYRQLYPADHIYVASVETGLARMLLDTGRPLEAVPLVEHAVRVFGDTWGPDHPWTTAATVLAARVDSARTAS